MKRSAETGTATYQFQQDKPRQHTVTLAIPSSILNNAQSPDLKTYLCGQVCRAIVIFKVDEVVVFQQESQAIDSDNFTPAGNKNNFDAQSFMVHIMRYLECPQYLRRSLFPHHPNLKFAGLLNPIDAPHHLRKGEVSAYREGVVTQVSDKKCHVECGFDTPVEVPLTMEFQGRLKQGHRVTLKFQDPATITKQMCTSFSATTKKHRGKKGSNGATFIVSPRDPREKDGLYWGYTVREAGCFTDIFKGCPYDGGYDLTIGTSERGLELTRQEVQDTLWSKSPNNSEGKPFKHALIVFGGLQGIEACVKGDRDLIASTSIDPENCAAFFDFWLNTCPSQGSRTIRSEEAILITMTALSKFI